MTISYRRLVESTPSQLSDTKYPYTCMTERHLQAIWLEQKYFKSLITPEGLPITVISPGIWNAEAGPDFLKAHLRIGSQEVKGDVEIHLSDDGWYQHRHHEDERYNHVVFHLSLRKPSLSKDLLTANGRSIIKSYIEPALTISQARILRLIDLELYPYKKFLGSGDCAHSLFKQIPDEMAAALFKSAAEWRLVQKKENLQARTEDPQLQMVTGMATALGYKHNAEAFFELYIQMLKFADLSEDEVMGIGLGICGFYSERYQKKWAFSEKYQSFLNHFKLHSHLAFGSVNLVLHQIRPLNHPIRRLIYMVKMLKDGELLFLDERLKATWTQLWRKGKWREMRRALCDLVPNYLDPYWNTHYNFENFARSEFLPLIGEDLKTEMLVNTCLPILYEHITTNGDLIEIEAFETFYNSFPAMGNSKSRYLVHRFFGDSQKGKVLDRVMNEQGAFQLHKDFCQHYEASCAGCPFVERFNTQCT